MKSLATTEKAQAIEFAQKKKEKLLEELGCASVVASSESTLKAIEAAHMETIVSELDDNGKPIYSNAEKRQAELTRRLDDNETYQDYKRIVDEHKTKAKMCSIEATYCSDMIRILCAFGEANRED